MKWKLRRRKTAEAGGIGPSATPETITRPSKREMKSTRSGALAYHRRGWSPIPVKARGKAPLGKRWQHLHLDKPAIEEEFASNPNVGVLLGEASNNLVDVDLDSPEARRVAPMVLPPSLHFGRSGSAGSHWLIQATNRPASTKKFSDPSASGERAMLVELRSDGHQTVFPPSVHPSGEDIAWEGPASGKLAAMTAEDLERRVSIIASAALLGRHWAEGVRQDAALALSGGLLRAEWKIDDAVTLVTLVAKAAGDEEQEKRIECVHDSREKLDAGEEVTGWVRLGELLDEKVVRAVRSWLGVEDRGNGLAGARSRAADVVALAGEVELFHTVDREAFVTLPNGDHKETYPVVSQHFREWLAARCYRTSGEPPKQQALTEAISVLAAKAKFDGPQIAVCARIAHADDCIYLDLGDDAWTIVEVSPFDWRVVSSAPARFRRGRGTRALPIPVAGGDLEELRPFLNCPDDGDWKLALAWLVACFHPTGPFPLLILQGEQGSAKTTSARILKSLVDPTSPTLRAKPPEDRELLIAARNCHLLGYDNLSGIKHDISDALCRLATGGGIGLRQLYTDADEVLFEAKRPVLITGIDSVATRGDLADRSIVLTLPSIGEQDRRLETDLLNEFDDAKPRLFGALLTTLASVLRVVKDVHLPQPPRMADFARWGVALERVMGWPNGSFLAAYEKNRQAGAAAVVESDAVAVGIQRLLDASPALAGTSTDFLHALDLEVEPQLRDRGWPRTPNAMGSRLSRVRPALKKIGIEIFYERSRSTRSITILKKHVVRDVREGRKSPKLVRDVALDGLRDEGDEGRAPSRAFAAVREKEANVAARKRTRARSTP